MARNPSNEQIRPQICSLAPLSGKIAAGKLGFMPMGMQICRLMGLYAKSLGSCRRLLAARLLVSAALPRNPPSLPVCIDKLRTITSPAAQPASPSSPAASAPKEKQPLRTGRGCSRWAIWLLAGGVKVAGSARCELRRVRAASRGSRGTQARWSSSRPGWRCTSGRRWAGSTSWRLPRRWCSRSRGPSRPRGQEWPPPS